MDIHEIHELGALRHSGTWYNANRRAVDACWGVGRTPWSRAMKEVLPRVVLGVLDGLMLDQGFTWDEERKIWTK